MKNLQFNIPIYMRHAAWKIIFFVVLNIRLSDKALFLLFFLKLFEWFGPETVCLSDRQTFLVDLCLLKMVACNVNKCLESIIVKTFFLSFAWYSVVRCATNNSLFEKTSVFWSTQKDMSFLNSAMLSTLKVSEFWHSN